MIIIIIIMILIIIIITIIIIMQVAETAALLHRVRYTAVPELSSFGRHGGFYARQLERLGAVSQSQVARRANAPFGGCYCCGCCCYLLGGLFFMLLSD